MISLAHELFMSEHYPVTLTYEINITSNVSICKSAAATYRISTLPIVPTGEFITYTNVWRYNP